MKDILIFKEGDTSPVWWENFMRDTNIEFVDRSTLNSKLSEFNAEFYTTKNKSYGYGDRRLRFDTEEDCTYFLLYWT